MVLSLEGSELERNSSNETVQSDGPVFGIPKSQHIKCICVTVHWWRHLVYRSDATQRDFSIVKLYYPFSELTDGS